MQIKAVLMDEKAIQRALTRIAHEIIEKNPKEHHLYLVGIRTRGIYIAEYLKQKIENFSSVKCHLYELDITFYRDDLTHIAGDEPVLNTKQPAPNLTGKTVILVDDVLYTGRTVRCAIEALFDAGRPSCIQLAILIDRGHRELPIRPDYVGKNVPSSHREQVMVFVKKHDRYECAAIRELPETENKTTIPRKQLN